MLDRETIEPLPCPFCKAVLVEIREPRRRSYDTAGYEHPQTHDCVLGFGLAVSDVERWNRRSLPGCVAEPTKEMIEAGYNALDFDDRDAFARDAQDFNRRVCVNVYKAMLAAAQGGKGE